MSQINNRIEEVARECSRALSYYDRQNLEYEIERQYKIEKGYDKMGLNWAFTDEDRRNIRWLKEEAVEWVLLLEAIPIICQLFPQPLDKKELREKLAELEHEQWIVWAFSLMEREKLSPERIKRWQKLMIPYSELTEEQKDQDRKWADKSLALLQQKTEEAKREERERIDDLFQTFVSHLTKVTRVTYALGLEDARWFRQALKGGE